MARVLIAGCGYLGSALGARLAADGHEVFGLRRSAAPLPAGVARIRVDLADVDGLRKLPARLELVFYTAAADAIDDRAYRTAYVDGLRYLLAALEAHEVRHLVFASSTGVYAQTDGRWVDEDSPAEPAHFTGRRLLEGERLIRLARVRGTVVRFAGIYGPGRARLVDRVRRGEVTVPAASVYANRIHVEDCVGVLRHVVELPEPASLYVAADHEPADLATVVRWLAAELGVPPRPAPAGTDPRRRYGRSGNKRVRNARLLASGYRFRYPTFREGYRELIHRRGSEAHG